MLTRRHSGVILYCLLSSLLLAITSSSYEGLTSSFYKGLDLRGGGGGSISNVRTYFCFALEVLIIMFGEIDDFC